MNSTTTKKFLENKQFVNNKFEVKISIIDVFLGN